MTASDTALTTGVRRIRRSPSANIDATRNRNELTTKPSGSSANMYATISTVNRTIDAAA